MKNLKIPFTFIDKYDRNNLNSSDLIFFTEDKDNIHKSIFLSHIEAYKKHIESNSKISLILEDDSVPGLKFMNNSKKYLNNLPEDFDLFLLVLVKIIFIFQFI